MRILANTLSGSKTCRLLQANTPSGAKRIVSGVPPPHMISTHKTQSRRTNGGSLPTVRPAAFSAYLFHEAGVYTSLYTQNI